MCALYYICTRFTQIFDIHNKKTIFTYLFHPNICRHDLVLQVLKKKTEKRMNMRSLEGVILLRFWLLRDGFIGSSRH